MNRVTLVPIFPLSLHDANKNVIIYARKTIFYTNFKMFLSKSAVCVLHKCLNPIFLGGVFIELTINQFFWILCITMCWRRKERQVINLREKFSTGQGFEPGSLTLRALALPTAPSVGCRGYI